MSSMPGWVAVAAVVVSTACAGCAARASTAVPVGYAELRFGRTQAYYPHTVYQGRDVYYVDGRWIYRTDAGDWRFYRVEPAPLYRFRTTIRQAPPAPRPREEPSRVPATPTPAPPAERVR